MGYSWAGFQQNGCPHQLYRHRVDEYIAFLVAHRFNAVRLPLSGALVNSNSIVGGSCGAYRGMPTMSVLDDVLLRLENAGIFALLDMHTMAHPEQNQGVWCGASPPCNSAKEEPTRRAWLSLAARYCNTRANVLGADLFNEPFSSNWGVGAAGTRAHPQQTHRVRTMPTRPTYSHCGHCAEY